jgi:hypothetical protein
MNLTIQLHLLSMYENVCFSFKRLLQFLSSCVNLFTVCRFWLCLTFVMLVTVVCSKICSVNPLMTIKKEINHLQRVFHDGKIHIVISKL